LIFCFVVIPACRESFFQPRLIRRGEKKRFWTSQNDRNKTTLLQAAGDIKIQGQQECGTGKKTYWLQLFSVK
jgi:hypothetical protein